MDNTDQVSIRDVITKGLRHPRTLFAVGVSCLAFFLAAYLLTGRWYEQIATVQLNNDDNDTLFSLIDTVLAQPQSGKAVTALDDPDAAASRAVTALNTDAFFEFAYAQAWSDPEVARVFGLRLSGSARPLAQDGPSSEILTKYFEKKARVSNMEKLSIIPIFKSKGNFGITFTGNSPAALPRSAALVSKVIGDFLTRNEHAEIARARDAIQSKIAGTKSEVQALVGQIVQLRKKSPKVDTLAYGRLEETLKGAQVELAGNGSWEKQFYGLVKEIESPGDRSESAEASRSATLLRRELAGLSYEQQKSRLQGYHEESPKMRELRDQIEADTERLRALLGKSGAKFDPLTALADDPAAPPKEGALLENVQNMEDLKQQNRYFKAREDKLKEIVAEYDARLDEKSSKDAQATQIEKEVEAKVSILSQLYSALLRLDLGDLKADKRLDFLMTPVRFKTILPVVPFLVLSFLMSAFLGISAAFGMERARPSLKTVKSFVELGFPVLGAIEPNCASMAIRLEGALAASGSKTALFTGTERAEQGAALALSLAVYFAKIGSRVLLIDADLEAQPLAHLAGVPSSGNLGRLLESGAVSLQPFGISPRLDVVTGNPQELPAVYRLASPAFSRQLQAFAESYDYIFISARPCTKSPTAGDLSRYAGVSVVCCDARLATLRSLERFRDEMKLFLSKQALFALENAEDAPAYAPPAAAEAIPLRAFKQAG